MKINMLLSLSEVPIMSDKFRYKANRFYNPYEETDDFEEGGDE